MNKNHLLVTDRLILRPLAVVDAGALFETYSHPEAMRFWDTPPHADDAVTRAMIERALHPNACWWAICLKDRPVTIGNVGYLGNLGVPGMGYILHPAYWRQGYMIEAVTAALDYGFEHLGLDRVELWINDDNLASQRLAEKVGFTRRGRFRQKYHHHAASHEKLVYGLYVNEWRQPVNQPNTSPPDHFYGLQPILAVPDVKATVEYYRDKLGFTLDFLYGDPPTHGAVSRGEWTTECVRIQLTQASDSTANGSSGALSIFMGPDIDELCERYRANGVPIEREPATQPWGMREFAIRDCNGYLLRFGTPA